MMRPPDSKRALRQRVGAQERDDESSHLGYIDDEMVRGVCELIDSRPVVEQVEGWRSALPRGRGGRKAIYRHSDRLVLALMFLLVCLGKPPQIEEMAKLVHNRLSPAAREMLFLPVSNGRVGKRAIYHRLRRALGRLEATFDPFPNMSQRRPSREEVEEIQRSRDPEVVREMQDRLAWVMGQIIEMTIGLLDEEHRAALTTRSNYSVDATPILEWGARGQRVNGKLKATDEMSPSYESGWYHLHNKKHSVWAIALHILIASPDPYGTDQLPILAVAGTIDKPSRDDSTNAVRLARSVIEREYAPGFFVSDRAYFSKGLPSVFHRPLLAMGFKPIGDYKVDQLGVQAVAAEAGAIFVEGDWYCPSMPQELIDATKTFRKDNDTHTYARRIRQRAKYLFRAKSGTSCYCPANGPIVQGRRSGATASCALRDAMDIAAARRVNLGLPSPMALAIVLDPPSDPPRCCTNASSITLPTDHSGEKYAQSVQAFSQEWYDIYKSARSQMEGFNGYAKASKHGDIENKENRRRRNWAHSGLVASVGLAYANLTKIAAFYNAGGAPLRDPRQRPRAGLDWVPPSPRDYDDSLDWAA